MPHATLGRTAVRLALPLLLLLAVALPARAQLAITATDTPVVEGFDGFQAAGFAPDPAAGQYDSDNVALVGFTDGELTYGGTQTAGDFARGVANDGAPFSGGVYAYDDGADQWIWMQGTGGDYTPGTMTLRYQNNTGQTLTSVDLSYDIMVFNDQGRANSWNTSYSTDDVTYTEAASYTSPEAADAVPAWVTVNQAFTAPSLSIAPGDFFYVRFFSDDVSGGGSRDQIGVDNVSLTASATASSVPAVRFTATDAAGDEGDAVTLTVEIDFPDDTPNGQEVTVAVNFNAGTSAADAADFSGPEPATVTFSGDTDNETQTVTVTLTDADGAEGEETAVFDLVVTAGDANVGTPGSITLTITDTDPDAPITIAEARAAGDSARVTVEGVVTRAEGRFTYFQDETAGLAIRQTSGAFFDAVADGTITSGTMLRVTGTLSTFRGLQQISGSDFESFEVLSQGSVIEPQLVDLATLAANGEAYEAEFVQVDALVTDTEDSLFVASRNYAIVDPSDTTNAVVLRIPSAIDTEVDGTPVPEALFTFTGVVGQFDTDPPTGVGYQLLAIEDGDVSGVDVLTIADVRGLPVDSVVTVSGVVTRARGRSLRIQDSTGAIGTFQSAGPLFDAIAAGDVAPGDRLLITGETDEFRGLFQLGPVMDFTVLERGVALPAPQFVTLAEIAADGEQYESELIAVVVDIQESGTFSNNASYQIEDVLGSPEGLNEASEVVLRIGNATDSELGGQAIPDGNVVFVGVLGQFDSSEPLDGGYQLIGVDLADLFAPEYLAVLGGGQEVPAVASAANGFVAATVAGDQISVTGAFRGLSSSFAAAHLHLGYAGQNGGVLVPLVAQVAEDGRSGSFLIEDNLLPFTVDQQAALAARQVYANVHSADFAGGEVRGQMLGADADAYGWHALSGAAEVPFNTSDARGAVALELYFDAAALEATLVASGSFSGLDGTFAAAHLHSGHPGENGGVFQALDVTTAAGDSSGVFAADANTFTFGLDELPEGGIYANVHSSLYPGGEVRGDLVPLGQTFHHAALLPANETHEVLGSSATGGAVASVVSGQLYLSGTFGGLTSAFQAAHIHVGEAGEAGPVLVPLAVEASADGLGGSFEQSIELTEEQYATALAEGLYINVHSADFPSGEIRGQVLLAPNRAPEAGALTAPADGATVVLAGEPDQLIEIAWDGSEDPDGDRVVYVWQLAVDETFGADALVASVNAGTEGGITATYGLVDSLLADAGVPVGATVTLFHRALASDGSVYAPSPTFTVSFRREGLTAGEGGPDLPTAYALDGSFPNPTAGRTALRFDLPESARVSVEVYDLLGRRVLTIPGKAMEAARHAMPLDLSGLATGSYLYRLQAQGASQTFQASGRLTVVR